MSNTVDRQALVSYLDQLLDAGNGRDYGPNGLQVEGKETIGKIVTGVSACEELFVRAREAGADAVLVHHGIFWDGMPRVLTGLQYRRVAELIRGGMSLLAYHLPLDRHLEVGNNAVAGRESDTCGARKRRARDQSRSLSVERHRLSRLQTSATYLGRQRTEDRRRKSHTETVDPRPLQ